MNPLVIDELESYIRVQSGHLQIRTRASKKVNTVTEASTLYDFKPYEIPYDCIVLKSFGGNISHQANIWLAKFGVSVLFVNWESKPISQTIPINFQNVGDLKIAQIRAYDEPKIRLEIAKSIISAKVRKPIPNSVKSIKDLMLFEGYQAIAYWTEFAKQVRKVSNGKFSFEKRTPKQYGIMHQTEPVNALLNYGYTVLEAIVRKNILAVGLEQSIGFLHEVKTGKEPLVYDMQEPFRSLIDSAVLSVLPKISVKGFHYSKDYHFRMKSETSKILLSALAETFTTKISYKGKQWKPEAILTDYVQELSRSLISNKVPKFSEFAREHATERTTLPSPLHTLGGP